MDVATIAKVIAAIVAVIGAGRVIYDITTGRRSQLRAEYEFARKFLDEIKESDIHPYPLEKGYQAIAGTNAVKSDEIAYILSLKDPAQCLRDYVLSKELMESIETKGDLELKFKDKFIQPWSRKWRKGVYFFLYFIFAMIAFSPLLLHSMLNTTVSGVFLQLLVTIPIGGIYGWPALKAYLKINRGEILIANQNKHTQIVTLETK